MTNEELKASLLTAPKNGYATLTEEQRAEMEAYCKRYAAFMDECKTEREATAWAVSTAIANGFKAMVPGMDIKPGDKVFFNNRGKSIILAVVGSEPLSPMTEQYNKALRENLSIPLREIPRKEADNAPISASKVRALMEQGRADALKTLVPESTFQYLMQHNKEI